MITIFLFCVLVKHVYFDVAKVRQIFYICKVFMIYFYYLPYFYTKTQKNTLNFNDF